MKTQLLIAAIALAGGVSNALADALLEAPETARNLEIVREAFARWEDGEPVLGALLADDVVWTIPGSGPVAGTYGGKQSFMDAAAAALTSRVAAPLIPGDYAISAEGDIAIVRFDVEASTNSGAPCRNQFVWILGLEGGAVVRGEGFLDLAADQTVVDHNEPLSD